MLLISFNAFFVKIKMKWGFRANDGLVAICATFEWLGKFVLQASTSGVAQELVHSRLRMEFFIFHFLRLLSFLSSLKVTKKDVKHICKAWSNNLSCVLFTGDFV